MPVIRSFPDKNKSKNKNKNHFSFTKFFHAVLSSFLSACSFLTILPVPVLEWNGTSLRFFSLMIPVTGLILGALWGASAALLSLWNAGPVLRGAVMALIALSLTGGVHMDGFMDTCDAVFSRRDRETRLKILSDTHTGAFAVMGCAGILILQTALFSEFFSRTALNEYAPRLLACVPVWSRLGLALLFNTLPFAKDDGLARSLGVLRRRRHSLYIAGAGAVLLLLTLSQWQWPWPVPLAMCVVLLSWSGYCFRAFGGITGDLLGAFVELSETVMLLTLIIIKS